MDYIDPQLSSKSKPSSKSKQKQTAKCSWCDRKRARNDLCNVCRQKVESRARRLMEQKLEGDMEVVQKVMKYLHENIPLNDLTKTEIMSLILECFPFLMLKFQSENTYRGKKGNRCWCLPESVLKKLTTTFYNKDKQSTAIINKGGRQELCDLLMKTVQKQFNSYGINNNKNKIKFIETDNNNNNSGILIRNLKRNTMDGMDNNSNNMPPRKRSRIDNNNNSNLGMREVRIWGRSDTELLSFDITKLDAFLHKFENKVLNGTELERVQPNERIDFLKKRCKEFVKILTELRDYVLHLRTKVRNAQNNDDNSLILNAKNHEIAQLKKRIDDLSINKNSNNEKLMRCTTNLLSRLSSTPVDINLLRNNVDKLEQYHNLACTELSEAVNYVECIGNKIGFYRSTNMTFKQYTSHLKMNIVNNNNNMQMNMNNNNQMQPQMQPQIQPQIQNNIISVPINNNNNMQMNMNTNNQIQLQTMQSIQPIQPIQIQQLNGNRTTSHTFNNIQNINTPSHTQQQQFILTPVQIGSNNMSNTMNNTIPINATTLQSLQSLAIDSVDDQFGPYFDFGIDTESDTTDSLLHQYNVI